jgi:hypothetical protein
MDDGVNQRSYLVYVGFVLAVVQQRLISLRTIDDDRKSVNGTDE